MESLKRFVVLVVSGLLGAGMAVGYAWLTWSKPEPGADRDMESMAQSFSVCVVFFGATYLLGRLFAGLIGARALAAEIARHSSWHMKTLLFFSALMGTLRWWFARGRGFGRLDDWITMGFMVAFIVAGIAFHIGGRRRELDG